MPRTSPPSVRHRVTRPESSREELHTRRRIHLGPVSKSAFVPILLLVLRLRGGERWRLPEGRRRHRTERQFPRNVNLPSKARRDSCARAPPSVHDAVRSICTGVFARERRRKEHVPPPPGDGALPPPAPSPRSVRVRTAGSLLRNTTRATRTRDVFRDPDALRGYAGAEFYVRAGLPADALGGGLRRDVAGRLREVRSCRGIGRGPGNDAVDLVALSGSRSTPVDSDDDAHRSNRSANLERTVPLDYAIEEWKNAILTPLVNHVLIPNGYVEAVEMDHCDVTESLFRSETNRDAREILGCTPQPHNDKGYALRSPCDIYLISYLLSETNGQWEKFVIELIDASADGTLFYFAEPSPGPMLCLKELCHNRGIEFVVLRPTVWLAMKM